MHSMKMKTVPGWHLLIKLDLRNSHSAWSGKKLKYNTLLWEKRKLICF